MKIDVMSLICVIGFAVTVASDAAPFELLWYTVDGGGGASTSNDGRFSVSGTIGQPDAGLLSGAGFVLEGGFHSTAGPTLPLPPPLLAIQQAGTNVMVSWPASAQGFILEYADELRGSPPATVWHPVSPQPIGHNFVAPLTGTQRYFRLRSP